MLNVHRGSHAVILFLENVVTSRNTFDLRAYMESEDCEMEISEYDLKRRYYEYLDCVRWFVFRAFPNDVYLTEIKIEKPFSMMEKLILDEDSNDSHKVMFENWCSDYERTLDGIVEMWRGMVGVVDEVDYWKLVFFPEKNGLNRDNAFDYVAHHFLPIASKSVYFGDLDSWLKYEGFIKNFNGDADKLYEGIHRGFLILRDYWLDEIDKIREFCGKYSINYKMNDWIKECYDYVHSLDNLGVESED